DEFAGKKIFPAEIHAAFKQHLIAPSYSHCEDPKLMRALHKYDRVTETLLEELPEESLFRFGNVIFRKGKKLRKRFACYDAKSNRMYLFNPLAPVKKV
ncbi:MAG: hypothetical protein ACHQD9_03030, partial [Chitinophagales bacterium]